MKGFSEMDYLYKVGRDYIYLILKKGERIVT